MQPEVSSNDVVKTVLPNGLTVIVKEDHSNPVVAINVWFRIGSGHEESDSSGLAHFQEHMVFKGTETYGVGEIADTVKSAGGNLNAGTSYSYTSYYVVLPSRSFSLGLGVQADAMMNSTFDPAEFTKERLVVIEEARMYDDTPDAYTYYRTMELGFRVHNYRRPIAGYESVVSRFTRDQLVDFYRKYYRPGNAILVVVGDITEKAAISEAERVYGVWSGASVELPDSPVEPPQEAFRFTALRGHTDHAYLGYGFHVPNILDPDYPALEVLANLLGSGKSSRLYQRVREEKRLVTTASAGLLAERWPGYLMVFASMPPEKWEEARDALFAETMRFVEEPVSEDELLKARRRVEKAMYSELETVEGQASNLGYYEVMGDYRLAEEHRKAIHRVTRRDVMDVAGRHLTLYNCSLVAYLPEASGAGEPAGEGVESRLRALASPHGGKSDRRLDALSGTEAPAGTEASERGSAVQFRDEAASSGAAGKRPRKASAGVQDGVEKLTLPNGVRVLCRRRTTVPLVSLLTVCEGGARLEPVGKSGLSLLATRALLKGTRSYSAERIAESVENLGGDIESFSGFDLRGVYVNILREHLDEALGVYREIVREPLLAQDKVENEKTRLLDELAKRHDHPVHHSIDLLYARMFGGHPYAHPFIGDPAELASLTETDCAEWHRRNLIPPNIVVVLVGDTAMDEAMEIAERLFGDLEPGVLPSFPARSPARPAYPGVHEFTRERLNQCMGLVGFLAPPMLTKEAISLRVLDGLMTGLGGRLFVELRDKRSLGYMAGSAFTPLKEASIFYGYANPKPEGIDEAIEVILDELIKVTSEPVLDRELARSKEWLVGSQAISLQRNLAQAIDYGYYEVLGFGCEMVERIPGMIRQVTTENIRQAAASVFARDRAVCVKLTPGAG